MIEELKYWLNRISSPEGCTSVDARKLREYNDGLAKELTVVEGQYKHLKWITSKTVDGNLCGIRYRRVDDIHSGHIEVETHTICGEDIDCFTECFEGWNFCPYCGRPMENRSERITLEMQDMEREDNECQ